MTVSFADVRAAAERIAAHVHRTPVLTCATLDAMTGARLFFKCENLQKVGAFKARGAANAVFALEAGHAARGVATHSSGNHGMALARAAARRGIACTVVMPETASRPKIDAVRGYGGDVVFCAPTNSARETALRDVITGTGACFIPPFDDARVIAGQGTAAMELLTDIPGLDAVIAPVGGGGLISGTAIAARAMTPGIEIHAGEPAQADDTYRSLESGTRRSADSPDTIADGLKASLGELPWTIVRAHVHSVLPVEEIAIIEAMRLTWQRMKLVIEPSSAVALAAILANPALFAGRRTGVIVTGGNVDLDRLPW